MLTCYLDDSDANTASVLTIAGYVAEAEAWKAFEGAAEAVCDEFGVDRIHGRELDARKDCFKGWSMPTSIRFLDRIGRALRDSGVLFGVSRSIPKDLYKQRKRELKFQPNLSAYGFAFGTIVFSLNNASEFGLHERVQAEGVSFLVEDGNQNNPDLQRYIQSEVAHGNLHKRTAIAFINKDSCRAIQAADLYAFYSRRKANRFYKTHGKMVFFPDVHTMHVQNQLSHFSGAILEPYTGATNLRTGDSFQIKGLVTPF